MRKELYDLISQLEEHQLEYAKDALELVLDNQVYVPTAKLLPVYSSLTLDNEGSIKGQLEGFKPTPLIMLKNHSISN